MLILDVFCVRARYEWGKLIILCDWSRNFDSLDFFDILKLRNELIFVVRFFEIVWVILPNHDLILIWIFLEVVINFPLMLLRSRRFLPSSKL